jgi:hypothetical protein
MSVSTANIQNIIEEVLTGEKVVRNDAERYKHGAGASRRPGSPRHLVVVRKENERK